MEITLQEHHWKCLYFSLCVGVCVSERERERRKRGKEKEREGERQSHLLGLVSMLSLCFSRLPLFPLPLSSLLSILTPANLYYFTVVLKKEHSVAWKHTFLSSVIFREVRQDSFMEVAPFQQGQPQIPSLLTSHWPKQATRPIPGSVWVRTT